MDRDEAIKMLRGGISVTSSPPHDLIVISIQGYGPSKGLLAFCGGTMCRSVSLETLRI